MFATIPWLLVLTVGGGLVVCSYLIWFGVYLVIGFRAGDEMIRDSVFDGLVRLIFGGCIVGPLCVIAACIDGNVVDVLGSITICAVSLWGVRWVKQKTARQRHNCDVAIQEVLVCRCKDT